MRIQSTVLLPNDDNLSFTDQGVVQLPLLLPLMFRTVIETDKRKWEMFIRRHELDGQRSYTLEELGAAFNISRERVRQLNGVSLKNLTNFLQDGELNGRAERLHPNVRAEIKRLSTQICDTGFPIFDEHIWKTLSERYALKIDTKSRKYFELLLSILGIFSCELPTLSTRNPVIKFWMRTEEQKTQLVNTVESIEDAVYGSIEWKSAFDLKVHINGTLRKKQQPLLEDKQLTYILSLNPTLEVDANGSYRLRIEYLNSNELRAERVLYDAAQLGKTSLSTPELTKEINSLYVKAGLNGDINSSSVSNACAASPNILRIGGTGKWILRALADSNDIETRDLYLLMEEALIYLSQPASAKEIHEYVSSKRECLPNTVHSLLDQHPKIFARHGRGTWALRKWNLTEYIPTTASVDQQSFDDAIEKIFAANGGKPMMRIELTKKVRAILGWQEVRVHRRIASSPRLDVETNATRQFRVHRREERKVEADGEHKPISESKRSRVQAEARRILGSQEDGEMKLLDLVVEIEGELYYKRGVIYNSIEHMADVETTIEEQRSKVCRLLEN